MTATQSLQFWTLTNPPALVTLPMLQHPAGGALYATQVATGLSGPGAYFVNGIFITEDVTMPDGGFVIGMPVEQQFGGSNCVGGREAVQASVLLTQPTSPTNPNRNYVALQATGAAQAPDNGTSPHSHDTASGAVFGIGAMGWLKAGALNYMNVVGIEIDIAVETGASVWYKAGMTICGHTADGVKGAVYDCLLGFSCGPGPKFNHVILIGDMNSNHPTDSSSTLMGTTGAGVAGFGLDFRSYTIPVPLAFKDFTLSTPGLGAPQVMNMGGDHARLFMGSDIANFPGLFFRSSGLCPPGGSDSAVIAEGGNGTNGHGGLQVQATVAVGGPVGGFKEPGSINAEKLYANGVDVAATIAALAARVAALEAHNPH